MSVVGRFCCKSLFASLNINFPGRTRGDQTLIWGTTLSSDELTGDFGNGLEATSIGDCGSFGPFARNCSNGILGVLQQNPLKDGVIGRPSLWIAEDFWVLRFRLMVKRGPWRRPQASEGEAQHGPFCWIGRIGQGDQHLHCG